MRLIDAGRVLSPFEIGPDLGLDEGPLEGLTRSRPTAQRLEAVVGPEAERARALRDRVLGVVAHDLRSPLNAIRFSAALIRAQSVRDGCDAGAALAVIDHAVTAMERLASDLLDAQAIEQGRLSMHLGRVDLAEVVRQAVEIGRTAARDGGIEIEVVRSRRAPTGPCLGDPLRLGQVLANLLSNAIRHSPEHGKIQVAISGGTGAAPCISVSDRGPGVAANERSLIFDPLVRGRHALGSGTGLGLAIARAIVEAHGGRLWVESRRAGGASFRFTLGDAIHA